MTLVVHNQLNSRALSRLVGVSSMFLALTSGCARNAGHQPESRSVANAASSAPTMLMGEFEDDYGARFSISATQWRQLPRNRFHLLTWHGGQQYLIARNDSANSGDGGLYTRIDWLPLTGMAPYEWGFCFSAYKAPTADSAEATHVVNRETPRTGCNKFPFTRMKRAGAPSGSR